MSHLTISVDGDRFQIYLEEKNRRHQTSQPAIALIEESLSRHRLSVGSR